MSDNDYKTVKINGNLVYYKIRGSGPIKILCMPRALGCSQTDFMRQLYGLDPTKFTVVSWDPPGYGNQ